MTVLYLVRHGQTEWSRLGRYTSITDVGLTDIGRQQAATLASRFRHDDFPLVMTSPRHRARTTADLAGFDTVEVNEDLAEWNYGDYEGKTIEEIHQIDPEWQVWTHPTPGGEQAKDVMARASRVVERVRTSGVDQALCFGHGHILRVIALCWIGAPIRLGSALPIHTGRVSILGYDEHEPGVLAWNT
ncbi:MAG: histidine phosphatase family protein [Propionibacteriaceae bacterium]|nr:histidine phosphatase family protein [Propionibacteriaceae bacterium]